MPSFLFRNTESGVLVRATGEVPFDAAAAVPAGDWQVAVTSDWAAEVLQVAGETEVFLLAGQSNATAIAPWDGGADWPAEVRQWGRHGGNDGVLIPAARPLEHWSQSVPGGLGWALQFALDRLAARPAGTQLVLVPAAQNATSFAAGDWRVGDPLYADAVARVNAVMAAHPGFAFRGILWHQGESDALEGGAAAHRAALEAMIAGMRAGIAAAEATTPFVCGGMVPAWTAGDTARETVQANLEALPGRIAHTGHAASTGLTGQPGNGIHFDAASLRELGRRYATALEAAAANVPAVPGRVAGLAASPGDGAVTLAWTAPAPHGAPISDYLVEVDAGDGWSPVADGTGTATGFTHAGLVNGVAHAYRVAALNAVGTGPASEVVSATPAAAAPGAEAGAAGHWLFGTDNPGEADLLTGQALAPNGAAPGRAAGYLTVSGQGNGLLSAVADSADVTFCAVIRRRAGQDRAILGGTMDFGAPPSAGWAAFTYDEDQIWMRNIGGSEIVELDTAAPADRFLFLAISLSAAGDHVCFRGGAGGADLVDVSTSARGSVRPLGIALGDVHYDDPSFAGGFDCAELILFQAARSAAEIAAIRDRSVARLAARGIAVLA